MISIFDAWLDICILPHPRRRWGLRPSLTPGLLLHRLFEAYHALRLGGRCTQRPYSAILCGYIYYCYIIYY